MNGKRTESCNEEKDGGKVSVQFGIIQVGSSLTGASGSNTRIGAGHMIENGIDDDFDASRMTSIDHVHELCTIASFGSNLIGHGLIIRPPSGT